MSKGGSASLVFHAGGGPETCNLTTILTEHAEAIDMTFTRPESVKAAATWIDPATGLEWQCRTPGRMSWHAARTYARSLSLNGKNDWRLPTAKELETLLDRTIYRPVMRQEIPFQDDLSYWSSTTFGPDKSNAWIVMFDGAYVLSYYKTNEYHVRCVRD